VTWSLNQTDPYAYTLLDTNGVIIAEINFYDTEQSDNIANHRIATLAAVAPDLLATLQHYATHGDTNETRERTYALLKQLNSQPQHAGWGTT
jgi:hypothetical protein